MKYREYKEGEIRTMREKFESYLYYIRGYSQNTIRAYGTDIANFARWIKQANPDARWSQITRDDIDAYITYLNKQGHKATTTNRALSSISSLYNYFKREGLKVENPCKFESRRKIGTRIPNTIEITELREAYKWAKGVSKLMIGLLATTGIRIQEMLDLQWEDINWETGCIKINGKGNQQRIVYTEPQILKDAKNAQLATAAHGRMFWISQRQARYMLWQALQPYCKAKQLSPHAIRHSVATYMATEGYNVSMISKLLGHKHLETTQQYINLAQVHTIRPGINLAANNN